MSANRPPRARRILAFAVTLSLFSLLGCSSNSDKDETSQSPSNEQQQRDAKANDALFDCLTERGFAVTSGDDGSVSFVDPDDTRMEKYDAAYDECWAELADAGLVDPADDEATRVDYQASAQLNDCLASKGMPVIDDFPSEDTYVEKQGDINLFALNTEAEWNEAKKACPEEYNKLNGPDGG